MLDVSKLIACLMNYAENLGITISNTANFLLHNKKLSPKFFIEKKLQY